MKCDICGKGYPSTDLTTISKNWSPIHSAGNISVICIGCKPLSTTSGMAKRVSKLEQDIAEIMKFVEKHGNYL